MRAIAQLLVLLALAGCAAHCAAQGSGEAAATGSTTAGDVPAATGERLVDAPGHVRKVSEEWWGLVPVDDEGTVYAPQPPLPAELREDGLPVLFSGVVGDIPPNVRMWGTPLLEAEVRPRQR